MKELEPLEVYGVIIPPEWEALWITELYYTDSRIGSRVINTLFRGGVCYFGDFRNKDLDKIKRLGSTTRNALKSALIKTFGNEDKGET